MDQIRESRLGWPKIFGKYDRRSELEKLQRDESRWQRPVSGAKAWATIGSTIVAAIAAVAMKSMDAPPAPVAPDSSKWAMEARVTATDRAQVELSGRMTSAEGRLDAVERDVRMNLYIGCELLRRSQPQALPPHECSDDEQRARRGR